MHMRSLRSRLGAVPVACFTLAAIAAGCASASDGSTPTQAGPTDKSIAIEASRAGIAWRRALAKVPLPKDGCFEVTHPSTTWREVPCTTPPNRPQMPAQGTAPQTVGNGTDTSAQGSGPITWAEGSFPIVSGVTSETDSTANDYSLQLNSNPFSGSGACNGAKDPSSCLGWEQFVYVPGYAFIQYWLINYNNTCPSGWNTYGGDCWKNSNSGASMPSEPITALGAITLTGTAGSSDSIIMSVGNGTLYAMSQASVLNLNTGWTTAEFNVFGDGNGSGATFNSGSTVAVQVLTNSTGSASGPTCTSAGFTGETNNMSILPGSCCALGGDAPGILFTESNAAGATAARCPGAAEIGFERVKGDFNGDGAEDVIIVNRNGSYEYLGKYGGGFTANAWVRNDLVLDAVSYTPGDFNGDGKTDLIITTANGSYEYTGLAGGGFTPNVWVRNDLSLGVAAYVPGDFNGDGKTDVIITTANGSYEYTGLAAGGFTPNVWVRNDLTLGKVGYAPGDYNGDGYTDVIILAASGSYEYTGLAGGGFTPNVWTRGDLTLGHVNYAPADYNGDGKTDVIILTTSGSYEYTGLAAGGFTPNVWTRGDLPLGIASYVPGDFNGDGKSDVIIVTANGSYEYTGLAAGGFTPNVWTRGDLVDASTQYTARDFNGDGKTDLIIQTPTGSYEYTGLAAGGFTPNVWVRNDLPGDTTQYL